ncbi:MAG: Asp23/Gls24 family envelope stress response protein [Clostridiales bacterium]|jgi:uncharacterized alkaline shock family protein YloU|nr:Asp23/Gls24 family envelope stress response protein [Clostridiales bacterium]
MTEIKKDKESPGQVKIADEAIAIIAGAAALEIEGVVGMEGNLGDFAQVFGYRNLGKGVAVSIENGSATITLRVLLKFGYRVQDVSEAAQKRVKTAVETMTGLTATTVNINVTGILFNVHDDLQPRIKSIFSKKTNVETL